MTNAIDIKPSMITWAIQRAGFSVEDLEVSFPRVRDWLDDRKKPTLKQLEDFSHKVYLPLGYLFLPEPPREELPIPFFRTGQRTSTANVSLNVRDTIALLKRRQEWLRENLRENDAAELQFVGKFRGSDNISAIVADMRSVIGLDNEWASHFRSSEQTIEHIAGKIEDAGIVIVFNGIVENNTHRPIKVEECRGFVIVDSYAPFMFVNNSDAKSAQLFTIVHELAHIWIGHSAGFDYQQLLPADDPIEKLCDRIAAEFLVPEHSFYRLWEGGGNIPSVANHFKVSPLVIARRALDLNKIDRTAFFDFYNRYMAQLHKINENKTKAKGGDFYATARRRVSLAFAARVNHAVRNNELLYRDAYRLTGLKGDTYKKFFDRYF